MATIRFLGAAGTVTGSKFLIEDGGSRVLVDCGLFQGLKELRERNWQPFPVRPADLDAVIVTHAHLDHIGYLPALVRNGYRGPVYATPNTLDLARILLPDSGRIQEEDAAFANKRGYSKHRPALPLFTEADAEVALTRFVPVPYGTAFDAGPVGVTLHPAGHILGAAFVELHLADGDALLVSGDLGRSHHPLLVSPAPPPPAGTVVIESTYADRAHEDQQQTLAALAAGVGHALVRGATTVIPAFAVDRTEVVLHHLRSLMDDGRLPPAPIYVDSPMALAALRVYRQAIEDGDREIRPEVTARPESVFPEGLVEAHTVEESKEINSVEGPAVIVSASGMATGGRVLHHLARRLPDPRSSIVLVGYQAAGTRGRRLVEGEDMVKMLGRYVPVRARVFNVRGLSVHADGDELVSWLGGMPRPPDLVVAVHGEPDALDRMAGLARERLGWAAVVARRDELIVL